MQQKIQNDPEFRQRLKNWLENQDIFKISVAFHDRDVHNIALLANYLLYLKILFYECLRKLTPALELKKLSLPDYADELHDALQKRFNDVLKHDYEAIFRPCPLDEIGFSQAFLPQFKHNVQELGKLDFRALDCEIIGAIYNTLIENQEQHDLGQHFTNTDEVDLVCALCLNPRTENVLDSACGAGTFLVRAYAFFKHFDPAQTHQQRLNRLWGVEIAPFPALLATMNLCLLDVSQTQNYPLVIQKDFCDVLTASRVTYINPTLAQNLDVVSPDGKIVQVSMPLFDACI
ncbi:MAG: N-6 DNA methylase, partial [Bacteroidia bacterium]|nr:N-6 DNA methylase [Bacteroidia bacterium]